jgi:putative two-component system response regulator
LENLTYAVPNILVVDDINANLVVLTEMIRNAGYIARPVTGARQALSAIEALAPHLILLDISMPEMDGFDFCALLKKNVNTRDIPIIFISALSSTEDKIKGFKLGAVDYIAKPFEVEEVTLRINTHLKIYKMQQELEIYNKKLYKIINDQIRKIYEEQKNTLHALARLSVNKDSNKDGHLERIGKNSRLLAMSLQLSPAYKELISNSFIDSIELASPLHDIGKIGIPDQLLQKENSLSPEDMETMKLHTEIGANTLREIYSYNDINEFIRMAIDIAQSHHECWDGSGYPIGLKGTEIPLSARIVAIIDAYDIAMIHQMTSSENSREKCVRMIQEGAGTRFDPDIVNVFLRIQNQLKMAGLPS